VSSHGAAVFDLDGLLIDSEVLWHQAELEILVPLGAPIDPFGSRATKGMFVGEVVRYWQTRAQWHSPSVDDVAEAILQRVGDLVEQGGRLLPGALRALDVAAAAGPVALASSTPRALIDRMLTHFELTNAFDSIHSAQDEPYGKPHPGVFLTAAGALGVAPTRCVVLEDSAAGVIAAKAARMACIAVPAADERADPTFSIAELVLGSLEELDASWLSRRNRDATT